MTADWQLPPGVSRGLWDALHDPQAARDYDTRLADTPLLAVDIDFVRRHCPRPGRLVDLGCGTGRLSVALATEGYECVAVDLSEEMLAIVCEKAVAAGVEIARIQANLVELHAIADASFDDAACLFQTLGLISGADSRRRAVEHAFRLLRPGGVFVLHVHNRWFNAWTPHGRRLLARDLWNTLLRRQTAGDYRMPANQGLGPMPMHLFTRGEVERLLRGVGFEILEVRPIAVDGKSPNWLSRLRAYGYLVAARRPEAASR
ncbi:MAG TPA: methyltransferase domain-containing protein [Gemmataceae bacterium]|nr:methyltransferase domain-containing protein [Gemmataceae bacterium]